IKAAAAMVLSCRIPQLRSHFLHLPRKSDEFTMTDPTISEPKSPQTHPTAAPPSRPNEPDEDESIEQKPLPSVANHNKEQEQANR
ncbi:hypothetical protein QBC45DRAFT_335925, partial [Copromyces sp. CBS 386.78]